MAIIPVLTKSGQQKTNTPIATGSGNIIPVMTKSVKAPVKSKPGIKPREIKIATPKTIFDTIKGAVEKYGSKIGKAFQQVPNVDAGTKIRELTEKTKTKDIVSKVVKNIPLNNPVADIVRKVVVANNAEEKIVNFISNSPSGWIQGWGDTIERVSTDKGRTQLKKDAVNLPKTMSDVKTAIEKGDWQGAFDTAMSNSAFTVALDLTDIIPAGFIAKAGLTPFKGFSKNRKIATEIVEEVFKEADEIKPFEKLVDKSPEPKVEAKTVTPIVKKEAKMEKPVVKEEVVDRKVSDLVSHEGAPDKQQVVKYVEEIKAGGKPPLVVIKEGNKFGVEDGKHKLEAYKQLGITEVPTVEKVIKPKEVAVPREQLPVVSKEGVEKVSRLEARVTQSLDKTPQEVKDQLGSTYTQMNKKENIQAASKYVIDKPDEAMAVLRGEKEAPKGLLKNSIYVAMENQAVGDTTLARKLASLQSTRAGQELSILTEIDPNSPVKAMRDIVNIREEAFKRRYGGKSTQDVSKKVVEDIKKRVKVPDKYDWNRFVESIAC